MNNRPPILFTHGKLAIIAGVALVALVLAFPGKALFHGLNSKPTDVASLAYARAAFNHKPDDPNLRVNLAEKLYEISQVDEAEAVLKPLASVEKPMLNVSMLSLKLNFRQYFDANETHAKDALKQKLTHALNAVFPQIESIPQLEELAELSLQLGEPAIAARIYRKIIEIREQNPDQHSSARLWHWLGISAAYAEPASKPIQYYIAKQLQALLSANKGHESLMWAERYVQQHPPKSSNIANGH